MSQSSVERPTVQTPAEALNPLLEQLHPVAAETVGLRHAYGRVLAEPIYADRDSPPGSVSAMDGFAVRLEDLNGHEIPLAGVAAIGQPPPELPLGRAIKIVTGACVPHGTQAVIRREDVYELGQAVRLRVDARTVRAGENIRVRGENRRAGESIMAPGRLIDGPAASALAAFGRHAVQVYRKVRLGLLITGDEILPVESSPEWWQLRDSNGPALQSMFAPVPWLEVVRTIRVADALPAISHSLTQLLAGCDAVFITGGVSMGDCDYVPAAVRDTGCKIAFHKVPIRPGKPLLGATRANSGADQARSAQAVLGLPGNPVSVMVTARRFGAAALRKLAGFAQPEDLPARVRCVDPKRSTLNLWWYRPVRIGVGGIAEIIPNQGSGDLAAAACSDGFVEIPPGGQATDAVAYWPWAIA